jgi:hypothetical protein
VHLKIASPAIYPLAAQRSGGTNLHRRPQARGELASQRDVIGEEGGPEAVTHLRQAHEMSQAAGVPGDRLRADDNPLPISPDLRSAMAPHLGPLLQLCKMPTARLSVNLDKSRGQRHPIKALWVLHGRLVNKIHQG